MLRRAPLAVGFVVLVTLVALFVLLGSVVLPLKAVVMNFLSIAGSFGALVWIFQEGHLRWLLDFTPGPLEPALPVLLFCTLFGLSMDYEVLMLSRMREEWVADRGQPPQRRRGPGADRQPHHQRRGDHGRGVRRLRPRPHPGGEGDGGGDGASPSRSTPRWSAILVVPATMRLFGAANWWAPRVLKKLALAVHGEKSTP